ncbi:DUF7500 family protein [Halobaculum roseum]|uniref:Uncharacterized protein n=1 Tax=Halobaculum roseum TaxID=2175149 RepID=A0ABD5MML5_9EURY|nr:hypothetical protein [Halobaculum roseum]QZY03582.1 hypothetical protein K6T36_05295 [Halobaculum roseum]
MSDADGSDPDPADAEEEPVRDVVRVDDAGDEAGDDSGDDDGADGRPPVGRDGVVDPDDLDIRGRDGVDETDDGRYVISTGGGRHDDLRDEVPDGERHDREVGADGWAGADGRADGQADVDDPDPTASSAPSPPDRDAAGDPLEAVADELGALSASHGFALAVAAGGETDTLRVASGDPTDTLATALRWYARRVNPGEPAEETISKLLAASDLNVE